MSRQAAHLSQASATNKPLPRSPRSSSPLDPLSPSEDPDELRAATASPPPLFLPAPAVSQAQLALLFGSARGARPGESIHHFPAAAPPPSGKARPRRGALRISTAAGGSGASGGTWLQRGIAGIRSGFAPSH